MKVGSLNVGTVTGRGRELGGSGVARGHGAMATPHNWKFVLPPHRIGSA